MQSSGTSLLSRCKLSNAMQAIMYGFVSYNCVLHTVTADFAFGVGAARGNATSYYWVAASFLHWNTKRLPWSSVLGCDLHIS